MKEATGETSNAIVVILCVAILIAIFSYAIWPIIKTNFEGQINCDKAKCQSDAADGKVDGYATCKLNGKDITCPYKG